MDTQDLTTVLDAVHHELTTLHGLSAYDMLPEAAWRLDTNDLLRQVEAAQARARYLEDVGIAAQGYARALWHGDERTVMAAHTVLLQRVEGYT